METGDEAASPNPTTAPRLFAPLPDRTEDTSATYEGCLTELIGLLGVEHPLPVADDGPSRRSWQHRARRLIDTEVRQSPADEAWFDPLVRAAIYEPDPSFNRELVEPALAVFGRRRVQMALLEYLRTGTNVQRAGAARAWYWTQVPLVYVGLSSIPTPESKAEYDAFADLRREWDETALHVFVTNEDLDVRRCLIPGLDLRAQNYPEHLRETVVRAIDIARTHPDDYLRHRVEHQI